MSQLLRGMSWLCLLLICLCVPATAQHLNYYGGPVISNVHVVEVLYGSGAYDLQVSGAANPTLGTFYSDITGSRFMELLGQYSTRISGGTNQTIGNGTFDGLYQIVPSAANNGSTIDDTQIQAELLAQISAGHLPAPMLDSQGRVNTVYMIFFPPAKTITHNGSVSCATNSFCAYHGTTSNTFNSRHLLYGVHPDLQPGSACFSGCGFSSITFAKYTKVTSHELAEAITDPDVGIASGIASPLAWYDSKYGEVGDICNLDEGTYAINGTTYNIQYEFSNIASQCVLPPPNIDFNLSVPTTIFTVPPGGAQTYTVTVSPINGFNGTVTLSVEPFSLPDFSTASFSPPTITGSGTSTLTLITSPSTPTGFYRFIVDGVSGSLGHSEDITVNVSNTQCTPTSCPLR